MAKKIKKSFYCIVGCGNLGAHLAKTLSEKGEDVLIIDRNKKSFHKLGQDFTGLAVEGDATDLQFISELEIEKAKMLIAVTREDNMNLMVCQIAKEIYGLRAMARLYNMEKEGVYKEFGIDVICPDELAEAEINRKIAGAMK